MIGSRETSHDEDKRRADGPGAHDAREREGRSGTQSSTALAAVQRMAESTADPAHDDEVHEAAAEGVEGSGSKLPHYDKIQSAFGRHDVSHVQAYVGGAAQKASNAMSAKAYATGSQVAFASEPDLHTAAHEAAHVVQQKGGVQLKGAVGRAGDVYERHADEVADAVVAGRSVESLLDAHAGDGKSGAASSRGPVQRALLPGKRAEPTYQDGLSYATIVSTAQDKPPRPKKSGSDWTGPANKDARKAFKDVLGITDQSKFDANLGDAKFLQPGEVHGNQDYQNKSGDLPGTTTYKEYDVAKYQGDPRLRGHERIVVGADGKRYYTANHYKDFQEF